ncbi:hypothetical protein K491DRAFT_600964 [Lophiostoma macrostomum CBS 122681]|uniref:Uncharacterized protein n=1 Tax=Lophiostoma macrostomum CBS 122681 TaxID=1314788 RepID=A0A6A6T3N9_9PLEO|nr:hypothetical protein K491DRAFT_600964 [Lophiostoma macrostomum CBS 122681]
MTFKTNNTIIFAEQKIGRQLTSEESQTLAHILFRMEQRQSYVAAAGLAAGAWRWYTTMAVNRYPMYLPKAESINPNKFMFINGPNAQWAQLGKVVGQLWAQPLAARETATDPNLRQFAQDLKAKMQGAGLPPPGQGAGLPTHGAPAQNLPPHAGAPRWGRRPPSQTQTQPQASTNDDDDMSPTAGNDSWSFAPSDPYGDSSSSSERTGTRSDQRPVPPSPQTDPFDRRPSRSTDSDASSTNGVPQNETQNQPIPGQSAWDRLRRGANPTAPSRQGSPHREQRDGSTLGDGFTFVESGDERKRAQEQAQSEFDQRIERERQGKDFNSERRW